MANDNLSSHLGLATLSHLERKEEDTRAAAAAFEKAVRSSLSSLLCGEEDSAPNSLEAQSETTNTPSACPCCLLPAECSCLYSIAWPLHAFRPPKAITTPRQALPAFQVHGRGLLMCVRIQHPSLKRVLPPGWPPNLLYHLYVQTVHGVRTRPSGGDRWALFVEPPAVISTESTERVCAALRALALLVLSCEADQLRESAFG